MHSPHQPRSSSKRCTYSLERELDANAAGPTAYQASSTLLPASGFDWSTSLASSFSSLSYSCGSAANSTGDCYSSGSSSCSSLDGTPPASHFTSLVEGVVGVMTSK